MAKGSGKGSEFEREICKQLSLWWTDQERDDIFWRTSQSGGRATQRAKSGKKTFGSYGDIQAVDPIGQPFMNMCSIELKRGYMNWSPMDLIWAQKSNAKIPPPKTLEQFINQSEEDRIKAGVPYFFIIAKRDRKREVAIIPIKLYSDIRAYYGVMPIPHVLLRTSGEHDVCIMRLETFLDWCQPEFFADQRPPSKRRRR